MKCNRCDSPEELKWADNYVKGKPVNAETNKEHICDTIEQYNCLICKQPIRQKVGMPRSICSSCQLERFRL